MSEYKQPPPPYSAEPPPPGVASPYGFQVPPMQPPPQAYGPTTQQPMPGYYPAPNLGTTTTINIPPAAPQIVLINGCPNCRAGVLEEEYSCCGICCAIFFFPLGLVCCLLMRERRCTNCRATF